MVHQHKVLSLPMLCRFHLLTIQPPHFHLYFLSGALSVLQTVGDMVSSCKRDKRRLPRGQNPACLHSVTCVPSNHQLVLVSWWPARERFSALP